MRRIIELSELIESQVFTNDFMEFDKNIGNLIEEITKNIEFFNANQVNTLNEILGYINLALSNSDYLLLADILRYELVILIDRVVEIERSH